MGLESLFHTSTVTPVSISDTEDQYLHCLVRCRPIAADLYAGCDAEEVTLEYAEKWEGWPLNANHCLPIANSVRVFGSMADSTVTTKSVGWRW